nr:primosomal protein N' [Zhihengliuella flava]
MQGFAASPQPPGSPEVAPENPVARVILETPVPHLDQPYDYAVPADMAETAAAGCRVRVRFGGRELNGFITERRQTTEAGVRLQPLRKVISAEPVLHPEVLRLCRAVAERSAGVVADVLRAAIPPRIARVEKEPRADAEAARQALVEPTLNAYDGGEAFCAELAGGQSPKAVITIAPNAMRGSEPHATPNNWLNVMAEAVAATVASGRGAVVVVPDQRDVDRVCTFFDEIFGSSAYARLTAEDGATPRYRNFLAVSRGEVKIVVGTRSAAFAPVRNLGLVLVWEDHDSSHAEPRAPYHHVRETLLLRSELEDCGLLVAGWSRSPEAQRLVLTGWARELTLPRPALRSRAPRVTATSASYEVERDPTLHAARLPAAAWKAAHDGLERGPVLVQVARTGFIPALRCERCRESARCLECQGPLALDASRRDPQCRWCGTVAHGWACLACGGQRLRAASIGADRTAEELGRAFPRARIVSATGARPSSDVSGTGTLVVATPGAEPVADGGYAAVVLLDGDRMLARDSLRTAEEVLHRWFAAAALARPQAEGGVVVVTAADSPVVQALVRWDAAGFAERELVDRREIGLPPAVRSAALTGPVEAVDAFIGRLELPPTVQRVGPVILEQEEARHHRWLLFFRHSDGPAVTAALRHRRAVGSANREPVVNIRVDGDTQL